MPSQPRATASARSVTVAAWLILGAGCTGSGPGPAGPPRVCTLIGCDDGLKIDLDPGSAWPAGAYRFTVQADDTRVVCSATLPLTSCAGRAVVCEPRGVVTIAESGCALPAASHGFPQIAFDAKLRPQRVEVTIERGDLRVARAELAPVFETSRPNGADCPPTCTAARALVAVDVR